MSNYDPQTNRPGPRSADHNPRSNASDHCADGVLTNGTPGPQGRPDVTTGSEAAPDWRRIVTLAGLAVLGLTPWAQAQLAPPQYPAYCPPLTAFATPTLFDVFFGTTPIRFPFQ